MTNGTVLYRWILAGVLALPVAARAVPAAPQKTVTIRDHVGLAWTDELVHYDLRFAKGALAGRAVAKVATAGGKAVVSQVSDVVRDADDGSIRSMKVWFFASVPAGGEVSFVITPGRRGAAGAGAGLVEKAGLLELTTGGARPVGIAVVGRSKRFAWPVPAEKVPAPIQALILPSGKRTAPARLEVPFRVKSYDVEVTARGPLFAEVRVHYVFDVGEWTFKARAIRNCPTILIDEQFNTGKTNVWSEKLDRFWTLAINSGGFRPTQAFFGGNNPDPAFTGLLKHGVPRRAEAEKAGYVAGWFANRVNGYRLTFAKDRHEYSLLGYPANTRRIGCLIRYVQPGGDAVGFVGLDPAYWRNPLALRFGVTRGGKALLRAPLQMCRTRWIWDGWESVSPNYTGVVRFVAPNTVRRRYGIMLSRAEDETKRALESLFAAAATLSAAPLDKVKDWALDLPDPMAKTQWAAKGSKEAAAALEMLRARVHAKRIFGHYGAYSMAYHYNYAKAVYPKIVAVINDPARITAAQRRQMRRLCAFYAYDLNSPDTFPHGTGFHLNNPNMTIMAIEARVKSASLLPNLPRFRQWGARSRELLTDFFHRFTMSSGAPFENPHYTLGVSMNWAIQANELLMANGLGDALDDPLFRKSMQFVMNWLTPPDPRFNGHRLIMPVGNGSYQSVPKDFTERFVKYYRKRDPLLAGQLQWFGNVTMPKARFKGKDMQVRLVKSVMPKLTSGWFKDYGVIFRHGFGTQYETMMHLLAGQCFGHNEVETDQMVYSIYAKGQPIHLSFGNGYFPMYYRPWLRNRISFDMKMEAMERGRIDVEAASFGPQVDYFRARIDVEAASFGPQVDYFRAVREFDQLLPRGTEYPLLDARGKWTAAESASWRNAAALWDQPEVFVPKTIWQRQMVLVKDADPKGPNYFVLRDTFGGKPTATTDLSLWFLANKMTRRGEVFHFDGQCKVDMDVFVNTPAKFTPRTGKFGHVQQPYRRFTGFDPKYHPGGKLGETQLLLRVRQAAGKDYMVVLYPRLKGADPAATFRRLAPNAVLVTTPVSRDYVLLDSHPVTLKTADVTITAMAAAVRFYKADRIVVVNSEGKAEVRVAGKTITGAGPFTVTLQAGKVVAKTHGKAGSVTVK